MAYVASYINSKLEHCSTTRHTELDEAVRIANSWLDCPTVDCEMVVIENYSHGTQYPMLVQTLYGS